MDVGIKEQEAVVIDNGANSIRAGFSGEESPSLEFPGLIGRLRDDLLTIEQSPKVNRYVGHAAQARRGILSLSHPIERGVVKNWDDMLLLWEYAFQELGANSSEHAVQCTESSLVCTRNTEKMVELLFEGLHVPAVNIANDSVLVLYASGRTTGLVVTSGESSTNVIPIFEGHIFQNAVQRMNLAGMDLTEHLHILMQERYRTLSHNQSADFEIIQMIKEKLCYCAMDFEQELLQHKDSAAVTQRYELPDGNYVTIGNERFRCPEALFCPAMVGKESLGIDGLTQQAVTLTPIDVRKLMYHNIIVAGGSTMFRGFLDRYKSEILKMAPPSAKVKLVADRARRNTVWIGGSVLSSLQNFWEMWLTRKEYEESGPRKLDWFLPRFNRL